MASGRTIYIAGAGIAGMTLALALAKFGATVVVLERNPKVQEVGSGSTRRFRPAALSPNASTSIRIGRRGRWLASSSAP